jgi:hypothetical protein
MVCASARRGRQKWTIRLVPPASTGGRVDLAQSDDEQLGSWGRSQGETLELHKMAGRFIEEGRGGIESSLDVLARIILLARQFDADAADAGKACKGQENNDASRGEPLPDLTSRSSDLRFAIDSLSTDDQAILVALAWIGRSDFSAAEFDRALVMAFERHAADTAGYLMDLPKLGELLGLGAAACGEELSGIPSGRWPTTGLTRH